MTTFTLAQGTRSSVFLDLGTLASATYVMSSAYDRGAAIPFDTTVELVCDPNGTPGGNKQLVLFAKFSLDNSNFGSGPESGTTATDEADLHWVGTLPCNDTNSHAKFFSLLGLPTARYVKFVVKNDMGVALTSGGLYTADIASNGA